MIQWPFRKRLRAEGHGELETPKDETACFILRYENLLVGYLSTEGGRWRFTYSEEFKKQATYEYGIKPLIGFSSLDKVYKSEELWPFFALRIPSLEQPAVKEIIAKEHIDERNEVQLLKRFGRKTITNPFRLEENAAAC